MKYFLAFIMLSFVSPSEKTISHRTLTYDDFKGRPSGEWAALSTTELELTWTKLVGYDRSEIGKPSESWFIAKANFHPEASFIKVMNEKILLHEQGHFDITELHARKINSLLKNPYIGSAKEAYRIYDSVVVEWNKMEALYDKETDYSRNEPAQAAWREKITQMLNQIPAQK